VDAWPFLHNANVTLWKPLTFSIGLTWLLWGALFFDYPDWDIGVSALMAVSTYLTADKAVGWIASGKARNLLAAALVTWWAVDGSYTLYWSVVRPEVMIREGQWAMSLCLFLLAGFTWRADPLPGLRLRLRSPHQPLEGPDQLR
jgi:hypothetical protein